MQEEFNKIKEQFHNIQKIGKIGNWELDIKNRILWGSKEVFSIFEIEIEQKISLDLFLGLIKDCEVEKFNQELENSYKNKKYNLINNLKNGKTIHKNGVVIFENNQPIKIKGTIRDITEIINKDNKIYQQNQKLELILKNSNLIFWELDLLTNKLFIDKQELYKLNIQNIDNIDEWKSLIKNEYLKNIEKNLSNIDTKNNYQIEYQILNQNNEYIWIEEHGSILKKDENNKPIKLCGTFKDVTLEKNDKIEKEQAGQFFSATSEGIAILNKNTEILRINDSFKNITGYDETEVLGKKINILKSGKHNKEFYQDMWASISKYGKWKGEIWNKRNNGKFFPEWLSINSIKENNKVINYIAVFSDISELKSSEEKLNYLSYYDKLTNLPNKNLLYERISHVISKKSKEKIAFIYIDIDRFKNIIDSVGYDVGDKIIIESALRLDTIKNNFDSLYRISADEFVFVIENVDSDFKILKKLEIISNSFQKEFEIKQNEEISKYYLSASMGISIYPNDGDNIDTLIKNSNTAMYRAKEEGRNTYHFYESKLSENAFEKVMMENSLRDAIKNDEFVLFYQPQVDINKNKIIAAEALIRWNHPKLGLIPPFKFLGIAEETGLILELGKWVIEETCRQFKKFEENGIYLNNISANVSGRQLYDSKLIEIVKDSIKNSGINPKQLKLEITEDFLMKDLDKSMEILEKLKKINVSIALDDFGTGYSSLAYLKKFPIDTLKIDQIFIRDIIKDTQDKAITKAILELGLALELDIIAEGVETLEHSDLLKELKCEIVQGYFFNKPIPADEFEIFYKEFNENQIIN